MALVDPVIRLIEYTDPGCPFAFSAEPHRLRLRWAYGDHIDWHTRMIGLARTRRENTTRGLDPQLVARHEQALACRHGMPINTQPREGVPATVPACRAFVAVRRYVPALADRFLRRLRVLAMGGGMVDDPRLIHTAAEDVGLSGKDIGRWVKRHRVLDDLDADLSHSREPTTQALALPWKLSSAGGGPRFSAPSLVMSVGTRTYTVPGLQSIRAYEAAVRSLAPGIEARPAATDVREALDWADYPLATQEVAVICDITRERARADLRDAGATFVPAGSDGYWTT